MGNKETAIGKTGQTIQSLQKTFRLDEQEYRKAHRKARMLDALDRGKLWENLQAKFPKYQLLPQTNDISYIKNNILSSIYTIGKSAQLQYTSDVDRDLIVRLNIALESIWDTRNVAHYQLEAGERAALLNLGITQIGWDNSITTGKNETLQKGQVVLKNIDPLKYYRDPFAKNLDEASHVVTWEDYHETVIVRNPKYTTEAKKYFEGKHRGFDSNTMENDTDKRTNHVQNMPGYHRIYIWYVRDMEGNIHEIHTIDGEAVLFTNEKIKPNIFPFAELYCNMPAGDLIGTSEPARCMDNTIVYNVLSSMAATAEYKKQRPPKFVSASSGINVNTFAKHGADADKTFVVQGDARNAVHYQEFPEVGAAAFQTMALMQSDMQRVTGVDGKYTGRDTGSVITTGGVNAMLDQATVIDTPKILMYEEYTRRLTEIILRNYCENSTLSRTYLKQIKGQADAYDLVEVPFNRIPKDITFYYGVNISSEMPKNKARLAATADAMIEKQMQYQGAGIECDLITPQEWLEFQDIPNKEYMLERMNVQRQKNWTTTIAQAISQYASLYEQGVPSDQAMQMVAGTMAGQEYGGQPNMEDIAAQGMNL